MTKLELEKEVKRLRRFLCQLYVDLDKAEDYTVDCCGSQEVMWDHDIESTLADIQVALYGEEYRGHYDDTLDKAKQELDDDIYGKS